MTEEVPAESSRKIDPKFNVKDPYRDEFTG